MIRLRSTGTCIRAITYYGGQWILEVAGLGAAIGQIFKWMEQVDAAVRSGQLPKILQVIIDFALWLAVIVLSLAFIAVSIGYLFQVASACAEAFITSWIQ